MRPAHARMAAPAASRRSTRKYQTMSVVDATRDQWPLAGTGTRGSGSCGKLTNFLPTRVYTPNESDETLVERCLGGDQAAFEGIVVRYQRGLFNVALRMLGSYEDARDCT